jgi:NDP-sugar pyrophosphorylase family protein
MKEIHLLSPDTYGYNFIPAEYLPPGKDEYWQRNRQQAGLPAGSSHSPAGEAAPERNKGPDENRWRNLRAHEIEILAKNENYCSNWNNFLVTDPFEPALIRNSNFYGLIRLGALRDILLKHHDFCVPAGIRNSTIISCDIGNDFAVQDCAYISHYIIGDSCILSRIDEMQTTNHAKFGNGVLKEGEEEDVRVWIDVMNEAGGRSILPFQDMIPADAFLWAAYRDDTGLTERLAAITQEVYGGKRGAYGTIGSFSVIKSCGVIKDTAVGSCAYIKGANKLKNLTIHSSEDEPAQIGEGVEMVNGVVGYGCHIFYGSKAVRFCMGRNCNLKYGARLIHSVLGDNSTISCCEILNNLIFPVHEQHHNNSFLIASMLQGLSNIAAAATIGSNHNSRANDGEIRAGRGFWPGLAVTVKHSSRFAAFTLLAKGDYPSEMNIPFPFSMVNNNIRKNRLEVMPAYFWMYNLFALERNSWKSASRDRRKIKIQHIETDYLAPDTAEEIITAMGLLETWLAGDAPAEGSGNIPEREPAEIPAPALERDRRGAVVLKPRRALDAYREMLRFYAAKTLAAFLDSRRELTFEALPALLDGGDPAGRVREWVNCGGQIAPAFRVDALRKDIREGNITTWEAIHAAYAQWSAEYALDKARHAWAVLGLMNKDAGKGGKAVSSRPDGDVREPEGKKHIRQEFFREELEAALEIRRRITEQVYLTRAKDFNDPFRNATFRNREERDRVLGKLEDNPFIIITRKEEKRFGEMIRTLTARL